MNRIDRLSAILIQLQSKRTVRAQEIAERFETSLRTVYRDIRSLEEAGIPLVGEAGIGYSIMEGYRLPPVMFTKEEAIAFLVAEKIVEKYTDRYNTERYKSAMYKIKAVLRSTEKDFLEDVDNNIMVMKGINRPRDVRDNHSIQGILKAINEKNVLGLSYKANYEEIGQKREVEPIGIYFQTGNWYLIAFCRMRNDYRNFKVDRIEELTILEEKFQPSKHPSLNEYLNKIPDKNNLQTVVIEVDKRTAKYLVTEKYYFGFVSEVVKSDKVEMTFLSASLEGFARWYLMIAPNAKIIKPDSIKDRIKALLKEIKEKL